MLKDTMLTVDIEAIVTGIEMLKVAMSQQILRQLRLVLKILTVATSE